jgi:hypothetical protein
MGKDAGRLEHQPIVDRARSNRKPVWLHAMFTNTTFTGHPNPHGSAIEADDLACVDAVQKATAADQQP